MVAYLMLKKSQKIIIIWTLLLIPVSVEANYSNGVISMLYGQYNLAVKEFTTAAKAGHVEATYSLGYMYENSVGIAKDYDKALYWYRKAAALGDVKSQYIIGNMYNRGRGVAIDYVRAVKWYRTAAENGYAWAQYFLGLKLENGEGITRDQIGAAVWYERAANQEHARAQYNLANMYFEGRGVGLDYKKAYHWALMSDAYAHNAGKGLMAKIAEKLSEDEIIILKKAGQLWIKRHR